MAKQRKNLFGSLALLLWSIILLFVIEGCAPAALPLNYSPSSVLTASGATGVSVFSYLPAVKGKVEPNQIRNTAIGDLKFDQNIDVYFKDAVFKELRFVGIKVDAKDRTLTGEIKEFLIDDLGYSMDWALIVRYLVKKVDGGAMLYDSEKVTKRRTAKFANQFGALNETIKLNIDEVIKDNDFIKAIN